MVKSPGFLSLYKSSAKGALFLEIPERGTNDLLFVSILTTGFGSRDLADDADALDRGKIGQTALVTFRRFGNRVLLIGRNTNYYTPSSTFGSMDDAGQSFPNSVIAGFDVKATEDGSLLIEVTNLFLRDGVDIPSVLRRANQGNYRLDQGRSAIDVAHAYATSGSIEVAAVLALTTNDPPPERDIIRRVAADRSAILVYERNALVKLPDLPTSKFHPRPFDPRSGFFDTTYRDPTQLPNASGRQSFIVRHFLSKQNPAEELSEPEKPIVFYIHPGVPRELRLTRF